jgi:hypothetical protein
MDKNEMIRKLLEEARRKANEDKEPKFNSEQAKQNFMDGYSDALFGLPFASINADYSDGYNLGEKERKHGQKVLEHDKYKYKQGKHGGVRHQFEKDPKRTF